MGVLRIMLFLVGPAALVVVSGVAVVALFRSRLRKAREAGYPSLAAYLRAAPRTDEDKRDAADLALKGLVLCLLGLLFPPLLRLGAIGAASGIVAALGVTRLLGSVLSGVSATDPVSFGRALAVVLGVVVVATVVPAWRAARTNALTALRHH